MKYVWWSFYFELLSTSDGERLESCRSRASLWERVERLCVQDFLWNDWNGSLFILPGLVTLLLLLGCSFLKGTRATQQRRIRRAAVFRGHIPRLFLAFSVSFPLSFQPMSFTRKKLLRNIYASSEWKVDARQIVMWNICSTGSGIRNLSALSN